MKVNVFGGSGFVGTHVADALSDAGYEVTIYDSKPNPYLRSDQRMIIGDILDKEKVMESVCGCDYVYNFAGISDLDNATTRPLETVIQNIEGTVNILEACRKEKVQRFIYASTIYVYSNKGGFYRCSKQAAELYIEEYQKRYGLDFTILRYGTIYGPRADKRNSVYCYLSQAIENKRIVCAGNGEEVREYIHVRDAAALSIEVLSEKHKNRHVIVTGHYPMKFKDFLHMIREILNDEIEVEFKAPSHDSPHYSLTPYSFVPKIGYKLTTNCYLDMGQGLLECINIIRSDIVNKKNEKVGVNDPGYKH